MMAKSKMFARFATDENKEELGVLVDFGQDIKIRVRRLKSRKSMEVRRELDKPHANEIRRGALPDNVAEDLLIRQLAEGVISGWEGVDDPETGEIIPYTSSNAFRILKMFPELRDEIFAIAVDRDAFKAQVEEDGAKNLSTTSPGP